MTDTANELAQANAATDLATELERLSAAVTPGPWECIPEIGVENFANSIYAPAGDWDGLLVARVDQNGSHQDAALIVALRNNLPAIIAALKAAELPDDVAGLVGRLRSRSVQSLPRDWQDGLKCPECHVEAKRPKCFFEMAGSCPRHDPDNYEPSPYVTKPDPLCAQAADALEAQARQIAERDAEIARLREALDLALQYWRDRQQRYKNRHPVWVQAARLALEGSSHEN